MARWTGTAVGCALVLTLSSGIAWGQTKPPCGPEGRVVTPRKIDGQVLKVDHAQGRLTVRETNGTVHEFEASKETLEGLKVGDHVEANLREAPKCP